MLLGCKEALLLLEGLEERTLDCMWSVTQGENMPYTVSTADLCSELAGCQDEENQHDPIPPP